MTLDFSKNHFELFGLAPAFRVELSRLESAYRELQSQVHPDRFATGSDAEKRASMQWATRANEAYRTLKQPLQRARYLLAMRGVDTQEENNTAMPADFLHLQMAWREAVADARSAHDTGGLEQLAVELRINEKALLDELGTFLDCDKNHDAALTVRKLRFIDKLGEGIADAREALEH
jgi:molecular chaperone HscB